MCKRIFDVKRDPEQHTITISIKRPEASSEVERHFRTATKEMLLGFRALLDEAISRVEKGKGEERREIEVE